MYPLQVFILKSTQPAPLLFFPTTTFPPNWIKVPQGSYSHGRRQWNFERSEPIYFSMCGWPGINMGDALRKEFVGLNGKDDPVLQGSAGAISCRFLVGPPSPLLRTVGFDFFQSFLGTLRKVVLTRCGRCTNCAVTYLPRGGRFMRGIGPGGVHQLNAANLPMKFPGTLNDTSTA